MSKIDISFAGSTCNLRKVRKTFDVAIISFSLKVIKHKKHCEVYCPSTKGQSVKN